MSTCCILGLGYIGLPTAALLAKVGHRVFGVDINPDVVSIVNDGNVHIIEPDLEQSVADGVSSGNLSAQLFPCSADIFIITVPTPFDTSHNSIPQPNIEFVLTAVQSIAPYLLPGNLVLLESTSPVGTTEQVCVLLEEISGLTKDQLSIAYCPERVLPGRILSELVNNDRVIGGLTYSASQHARRFYSTFCDGELYLTDSRTAELVKLAENSFRDVNIAFANELSIICHELDIDISNMIRLANHHPRVNILQPGCGVGGHCIAVDPWFIASALPNSTPLIQAARLVNDQKSLWVVQQVKSRADSLASQLERPVQIGLLGITFKPDVDDLRQSPALNIVSEIISSGLNVLVCEPNLVSHPDFRLYSIDSVLANADLLVFLVAHTDFKRLRLLDRPILDFCGVTNIV